MVDGGDDEYCCRICLEPGPRSVFIAPCACKGSSKWVHRACLDQWRVAREDKAFSRCTTCHREYVLISTVEDSIDQERRRKCEFAYFVARDIILGFFSVQLVVVVLGLLVWVTDRSPDNPGSWLKILHMIKHPLLFYYLSGLMILLILIGLCYMLMMLTGRCGCENSTYCPDTCVYIPLDAHQCDCCLCGECGGSGGCCGGCAGADCSGCVDCSAMSAGGEVAVVLFVLLALVGLIVAVFVGIYFAKQVIQRHIVILQKRGLAKDFIVADLDKTEQISDESTSEGTDVPTWQLESVLMPARSHQAIFRGASAPRQSYEMVDVESDHGGESQGIGNLSVAQQRQLNALGLL